MLLDTKPTNFMMTPENVLPVYEYNAEFEAKTEEERDTHLLSIIEEIEELRSLDDVRPSLNKKYKVRQLLRNSKLI